LFSSHQLDLVDRLCDSIVVLHEGRVVARGTSGELRDTGDLRYRLRVGEDAGWVRGHHGVRVLDLDGPSVLVEIENADQGVVQHLLHEALSRGRVHEFSQVRPSLSEIYREVAA